MTSTELQTLLDELNSPARRINGKVELYTSSTLAKTFNRDNELKSFTITRAGENHKFFGFGICQKLELSLIDKERVINIDKNNSLKAYLGAKEIYYSPYPAFYVDDVKRNENTNELTITAYDVIYKAKEHTVAEVSVSASFDVYDYIVSCASIIGAAGVVMSNIGGSDAMLNQIYTSANYNGDETIREALDDIAEATQTIYYIDKDNNLVFKRLSATASKEINKSSYFEFTTKEAVTLRTIAHTTELGENIEASKSGLSAGVTQYVKDNGFWGAIEPADLGELLTAAAENYGGLSIAPFSCTWRGNFLWELGDYLSIEQKDGSYIQSFLIDDTITYNGGLSQKSKWEYSENSAAAHSNPATIGEVLNDTYAKVDKANKQIDLVATETAGNKNAISALQVNLDGINASVITTQNTFNDSVGAIDADLTQLKNEVNAKVSATDVKLSITEELTKGIDKVTTSTGFTFDANGLTVSKSDSEIRTTITEDGMRISRNYSEVLVADNQGVKAEDLHATTYLIIGNNARLEDYGGGRTACYWVGGLNG